MVKEEQPRIVIVGSGFGGLEVAKHLRAKPVDVLLIDKNNYFNFQPLMYQVATGGLEPDSIAYPIRRIFRNYRNVQFRMAEVTRIDTDRNCIETDIGNFAYDYLVIATGSTNNFFNFEPVKEKLLPLKSVPESLNMRSYIYQNLERAMDNRRGSTLEEVMNIAIVGGGPAGIELAGAIAEMKHYVVPKDFPGLDTSQMNINLYQGASRLLPAMSEQASLKALEYLRGLGVNVYLDTRVSDYDGDNIRLEDGSEFKTDTVIWTAGVRAAPVDGLPSSALTKGKRVLVDDYNRVVGTPNVFAIGDVASMESGNLPDGHPMMAPVAQQQGRLLARNLLRSVKNQPLRAFEYRNKGVMATVGRKKAVVDLPGLRFQGSFAWFVWMLVHILSLVGFRNKIMATLGWAASYFNYDRPLGLIIRPYRRN